MRGATNVIKTWVIIFVLHLFLTVGSQEDETIPEWMTTSTISQLTTTSQPPTGGGGIELPSHIKFSTDDYVQQTLLQFDKLIAKMNSRLAVLKEKYEYALNVLIKQKDSLLEALYDTIYNKIEPLRWLSDESRKCIEMHADNLTSFDVIENKIKECVDVAMKDFENLLAEARQTRDDLNKYYNETLRNELNQCKNQHQSPSREYFQCSYDKLTLAHRTTREKSRKFDAQYEAARCAIELRIKRAVDCSFSYTWDILSDMGIASRILRLCAQDKDTCSPCPSK